MSNTTNDQPALTNGWDTVYAVQFPAVNNAIISQKSSPKDILTSIDDPDSGKVQLSGDFGDWQICLGGDGKNIKMLIPINSSVLTFSAKDHKYTEPVTATIGLNLLWVSATDQDTSGPGKKSDLKVNAEDTVSVLEIDAGKNEMTETQKSFFRMLLEKWLKDNVGAFKHVFAVIEINKQNATGGFQWLMPTDTLYAVVDVDNDIEKCIFGVLCMTENRISPGAHQISPFAIPADCPSGLLIAPERILSNMILPGVKLLFNGAKDTDFEISDGGLTITNVSDLVSLDQELENGNWIRPRVKKGGFSITIRDTFIEIEFTDLYFNYPMPLPLIPGGKWTPDMPGITVHMLYTSSASLSTTTDNKLKMDIKKSTANLSIKTETWLTVTEIVSGIVLSVGGALAGGVIGASLKAGTQGAAAVTEAAIEGIEMSAVEAPSITVTNIANETIVISSVEAASVLSTTATTGGKFVTYFASNWAKILGGMIGAGIGATVAATPEIIKAIGNSSKGSFEDTLDQFAAEALAPLTWPEQGPVELKSGTLNGSFQMGFTPKVTNP